MIWDVLDAELLDVLQAEAAKRGKPLHVRTAETRTAYPLVSSRATPTLICAYCGRRRCDEHKDLPNLDPYFTEARR